MAMTVKRLNAEGGFDAFYRRHYSGAVALAHALAGPRVAEDIAQDAFAAALRTWDQLETPERWLRRVVANQSRSALRRAYAEARALRRLTGERTLADVPEPTDEFWAEVRRLPRRQAQVIALIYIEELTTSEVAATLECAEATVRVHLHRARQTLAEQFGTEA